MNWPGLLKWSLNQHTDNKDVSNIEPMSEEDKQWVRDMIKEYEVDVVKEMEESIKYVRGLKKSEDPDYEDKLLSELEIQVDLIQGVENANIFTRCGGIELMFDILKTEGQSANVVSAVCLIISESSKNNPFVQERSLSYAPFDLFNLILRSDSREEVGDKDKVKVEKSILNCLSALIRGLFLRIKRLFLEVNGLEFVLQRLDKAVNSGDLRRMKQIAMKVLPLLEDLVLYDSQLSGGEDLLMTEQDKIIKQKKEQGQKAEISLTIKNDNPPPETPQATSGMQLAMPVSPLIPQGGDNSQETPETGNQKFQDTVKKTLYQRKVIDNLLKLIKTSHIGFKILERAFRLIHGIAKWDIATQKGDYIGEIKDTVQAFETTIEGQFEDEEDRKIMKLHCIQILVICK